MATKSKTKSYSQLSAELAAIMEWFESGDIDLDEAMDKYQQASKIIEEMDKYLKTAANKIKKISSAG